MNYLAHLFLAHGTPETVAGNLLADFVKGSDFAHLSKEMRRGVQAHRRVDAFTDSHPVVTRSRVRLSLRWPRVSGILTDIYFDHVLARDWALYSPVPLRQFLDRAYESLNDCMPAIPPVLRQAAQRLIEHDLLMKYQQIEGVEWALTRMSRRLGGGRFCLEQAVPDLVLHAEALSQDFHAFFPELRHHAPAFHAQE